MRRQVAAVGKMRMGCHYGQDDGRELTVAQAIVAVLECRSLSISSHCSRNCRHSLKFIVSSITTFDFCRQNTPPSLLFILPLVFPRVA